MRLPAKAVVIAIALLALSQVIAITVESQAAALFSWYLVYALVVLVPLTLLYAGFRRLSHDGV